jgi:hypothetical protein
MVRFTGLRVVYHSDDHDHPANHSASDVPAFIRDDH